MSSNYYGGVIWTNHVLERMEQRQLSRDMTLKAFRSPDKSFAGKEYGTTEYQKQFGNSRVTVIAKQNEKSEWLILSTWIDPPVPGTNDSYKKNQWKNYQKAGFWGKMWITFRQQLGF